MEPLEDKDVVVCQGQTTIKGRIDKWDYGTKIPIRRCCVCGHPCFMYVIYGGIFSYPVHEGVCLRKLIKQHPEKFEVEALPKGSKFVFR